MNSGRHSSINPVRRVREAGMERLEPDGARWFVLPSLAGFAVFFILPFLLSLWYAFQDKPVGGTFIGLQNFIDLFRNKAYLNGLKNTAIFIGFCIPLNIALSLALAMMINKVKAHKALFSLIFLIPLVIPSGSMVFFWKMMFNVNGYVNGFITKAGFDKVSWLETGWAMFVVILIFLWKNIGYNMVLFSAGLSNIPKEYYEAAQIDGADSRQSFWHITAVYLLPVFVLTLIMSLINSFKVFKEIYLITGEYPHDSIYMLQHFMNNMFFSLNYQKLTTATTVLVVIITVLTQMLLRFEKKVAQ
jgi:multiple sugar transport system permease protein